MPKRTNDKQQIIEMLKALEAPIGSTVTASRMLKKNGSSKDREVDVVVEHESDGETFTQCFEVIATGRPATVEWVERMIGKHSRMPTDRLCLVSWSGFTEDCAADARCEPWVSLVTPELINGIATLTLEELFLTLGIMRFGLRKEDGSEAHLELTNEDAQTTSIYSTTGEVQGTAWTLGNWILQQSSLWQPALDELSKNPRSKEATWADLSMPASVLPPDLWLRAENTDQQLPVSSLRMFVGVQFKRQLLTLEARKFRNKRFGHTAANIVGERKLIVAELANDLTVQRIQVEASKSPTK